MDIEKIKKDQSNYWSEMGKEIADHYWNYNSFREERLVKYFKNLDINSIFEIGTNSGRNLYYINKNIPNKILGGMDINKIAIEIAKKNLPHANLYNENIFNMDVKEKYDVVFTSGVLLHIPPQCIYGVVKKCTEKSLKYVAHMEPTGNNTIIDGPKELGPARKTRKKIRCMHNICEIYNSLGFKNVYSEKIINKEHFIVVKIC